jgi:hypothetical protein
MSCDGDFVGFGGEVRGMLRGNVGGAC